MASVHALRLFATVAVLSRVQMLNWATVEPLAPSISGAAATRPHYTELKSYGLSTPGGAHLALQADDLPLSTPRRAVPKATVWDALPFVVLAVAAAKVS